MTHVLERIPWPRHGSSAASRTRAEPRSPRSATIVALIASEEPEAYELAAPVAAARRLRDRLGQAVQDAVGAPPADARDRAAGRARRTSAHEAEIICRLGARPRRRADRRATRRDLRRVDRRQRAALPARGGLRRAARREVGRARTRRPTLRRAAVGAARARRALHRRTGRTRRARSALPRARRSTRPRRRAPGSRRSIAPPRSSASIPAPRTWPGCSASRSSTSSPTRSSKRRRGAGGRGPASSIVLRASELARAPEYADRAGARCRSDRALLIAAGGGLGDTLLAGVVAHALRARFARVDALVLPAHRDDRRARAGDRRGCSCWAAIGHDGGRAARRRVRGRGRHLGDGRDRAGPAAGARFPCASAKRAGCIPGSSPSASSCAASAATTRSHWTQILLDYARALGCDAAEPRAGVRADRRRPRRRRRAVARARHRRAVCAAASDARALRLTARAGRPPASSRSAHALARARSVCRCW